MTFSNAAILMTFGLPVLGGVAVFAWSEFRSRKRLSHTSLPEHKPVNTDDSVKHSDSERSPLVSSAEGVREAASVSLTPEIMREIRLQEVFRHEVQQEIEKTKPDPHFSKRLVAILNSPFGLWILSSIVLALLVNFYATVLSHLDGLRQKRDAISWLDLEITHHIASLHRLMGDDGPRSNRGLQPRAYLQGLSGNLNGSQMNYLPLYPAATDRSLHSLMYQLATYIDDEEEKARINAAANSTASLFDYIIELRDSSAPFVFDAGFAYRQGTKEEREQWDAEVEKQLALIRNHQSYNLLQLPRWKSSSMQR